MQRWQKFGFLVIMTILLQLNLAFIEAAAIPSVWSLTYAQSESHLFSQSSSTEKFPVTLGKKTLFTIQADAPQMYASQRSRIATEEIQEIARDYEIPVNTIIARQNGEIYIISQILTNDELRFIVFVNQNDAAMVQRPLVDLTNDWLQAIQEGIVEYRQEYSLRRRVVGVITLVIATIILIILLGVTQRLSKKIQNSLDTWRETRVHPIRFRGLDIITVNQQVLLAHSLISLFTWGLIGLHFVGYFILIIFLFPKTENFGRRMLNFVQTPFISIWESVINFLPNLVVILLVILVARFAFKTNKLIFDALATGRVRWFDFYQDWARPTQKLVSVLIVLVTLAIILPYLPIFESPAIQGLGLLAGALLTVGGGRSAANIIAGYTIIFSRPFQVGDLIAFDTYQGFIHKKSILATQIRTFDDQILTIPNDTLQSKTIINYSAAVHELNLSLAMRTTITLGYDVPWRQVHSVLVEAALATPSVLADPAPFVLQTSLDDFYVTYQLKNFFNEPEKIEQIYSDLLQNVQDYCNAAGIEIMSPHYAAVRDGNQNTIPASYLPKDYTRPGFQVELPHSSTE